jgi:hypothetical protein
MVPGARKSTGFRRFPNGPTNAAAVLTFGSSALHRRICGTISKGNMFHILKGRTYKKRNFGEYFEEAENGNEWKLGFSVPKTVVFSTGGDGVIFSRAKNKFKLYVTYAY